MKRDSVAIFAIHGFSGHPEEVRFVGERIANALGAPLVLPIIPGHATSPADLLGTTHLDWYRGIEEAYDQLAARYAKVVVIGNSFGANLALKLARSRSPAAMIAIATAYLTRYQRVLLQLLLLINRPFRQSWIKPKTGPHATEQIPGYTQQCYEEIPLGAFWEMLKFDRQERPIHHLAAVRCPSLLVSPRRDPFISPKAVTLYYDRLGSSIKELLVWDEPYHLIVQGTRKLDLAKTLTNWLDKVLVVSPRIDGKPTKRPQCQTRH
ncbi:alpha/beta fold hydrolase [Candidatus Berkelbacteria bacterium]|nr:alpha/beta fold hydrolase [Candidatus Berkelbacteria bacterium]